MSIEEGCEACRRFRFGPLKDEQGNNRLLGHDTVPICGATESTVFNHRNHDATLCKDYQRKEVTAQQLREQFGYWGDHPDHAPEDWAYEVANCDTRQGYWDWVAAKVEEAKETA